MTLLVELSTRPVQRYLGFSDTYPLVAHSVATNVPSTTSNLPAVQKWLGVPFASAQRFSRPTPFVAHDDIGVVSAHEFGPVPWQPAGIVEKHWVDKKGWLNRDFVGQSEECLSCNILVPEKTRLAGQRIPVLVWCYGGACNTGHSAAIRHDATELVRLAEKEGTPVIVVTGNYRVNIFGFMNHEDLQSDDKDGLSGNYGFYDQLALFTWVKTHIAQFGGDADNITAFGESAGAFSIASLITRQRPESSPTLFSRVILQSGSPSTMKFHPSTKPYIGYAALLTKYSLDSPELSAADRIAGLRKIPAEELMEFAAKTGGGWGGTIQTGNVHALWEVDPEVKYREGNFDPSVKEFILGSNKDEGSLFSSAFNIASEAGLEAYISRFPTHLATRLRALYPFPSSTIPSLVDHPSSHLMADQLFLAPLHTLATSLSASKSPRSPPLIKVFSFEALLPQMSGHLDMGSHHGEEIPFVFGTRTFWADGSDEEKTSEECMRRWSSLATNGKGSGTGPEWLPYTPESPNRLIIGPLGGETRMEVIKLTELEHDRQKFWADAIADKDFSTAL